MFNVPHLSRRTVGCVFRCSRGVAKFETEVCQWMLDVNITQFSDVALLMASVGRWQHRWCHVEFLHAQLEWRQAPNQVRCMVWWTRDVQDTHAHSRWWPSSLVSHDIVWRHWGSPYPLLVWRHLNLYVAGQVCCRWSQLEWMVRWTQPGCSANTLVPTGATTPVRRRCCLGSKMNGGWSTNSWAWLYVTMSDTARNNDWSSSELVTAWIETEDWVQIQNPGDVSLTWLYNSKQDVQGNSVNSA